ncbi:NAD-dependent epimerase/dehydratase [Planococcus antarcticus DSM 14505]|uniref:NAD-dependent epimerase/dehydratase n=1 Tax=Planococcus antarcticus DSM 14505 TaxID=1185653 RepID=A0AA87IM74_9BACL|nr:NAD-dependent epimerase/dehydratase [Planococcus antarcticus DSM 14505]
MTGKEILTYKGDLQDFDFLKMVFETELTEAFVHFVEQRSASYSVIDRDHALYT